MTIEWLSTEITVPKAGYEIIAKNQAKQVIVGSAAKQCRVMKFLASFTEDQIIKTMLSDNLTLWSYTE